MLEGDYPIIGSQSHLAPNRMVKKTKLIFNFVIGLMSVSTPQTLESVSKYYSLAYQARVLLGTEYDRESFFTHQGEMFIHQANSIMIGHLDNFLKRMKGHLQTHGYLFNQDGSLMDTLPPTPPMTSEVDDFEHLNNIE